MPMVDLKKFYYSTFKESTPVEVSDEVAEALLDMRREEDRIRRKLFRYKAYYSLDCDNGIEKDAPTWAQPSPEDVFMQKEEEAYHALMLQRLEEAMATLSPIQSRRIRARYMERKKFREIAAEEGVSRETINESIRLAKEKMKKYFDKRKWAQWGQMTSRD